MTITSSKSALDSAFISHQKQRLETLLVELVAAAESAAVEEQGLQLESVDEVRDSADSAETMAIQENDEAVFNHYSQRLAPVRRALEKIDDGTYGVSDVSGKPIPRARLESIPEANLTLEENARLSKCRAGPYGKLSMRVAPRGNRQ